MAEEEQKEFEEVLDICGDSGLEEIIKHHFKSVSTDISGGKVTLRGKVKHVQKVKTCFVPFNIDNYRRQFIITEEYPLQYLNQNLGDEACYFTKTKASVSLFIPHNRRQGCKEEMKKLVENRIVVQKYDCNESPKDKKLVENLLFEHFGKIIVVGDAIVYTKDIEDRIKAATSEPLGASESQGAGVSDTSGYVVDHSCLGFIRKHFPNVRNISLNKTDTDLLLTWNKSKYPTDPILVLDLKINRRKEQLVLTERDTRKYLNTKLANAGISCCVAVHSNSVVGLVPSSEQYVDTSIKPLVCDVIENSICVVQYDDKNDLLSSFCGKYVCLEQDDGSFLVYTDDLEKDIENILKSKQCGASEMRAEKENTQIGPEGREERPYYVKHEATGTNGGATNSRSMKTQDDESSLGSFENDFHKQTDSISDDEIRNGDKHKHMNFGSKSSLSKQQAHGVALPRESGSNNIHNKDDQFQASCGEKSDLESNYAEVNNLDLDLDLAKYIYDDKEFKVNDTSHKLGCAIHKDTSGRLLVDGASQQKVTERVNKIADSVCMYSTFVDNNYCGKCETGAFKEMMKKLKTDGTQVVLHPCANVRAEHTIMFKGVRVVLVHGSAADIPKTDVLVCPLDLNPNRMCAAAKHIMSKGGETLRHECLNTASSFYNQQRAVHNFQSQYLKSTGDLPVKNVCCILLDDQFRDMGLFQRQMTGTVKQMFDVMVKKQRTSYTFPLEVGKKVPATVIAKACCVALYDWMSENPANIKEIFLCVVNENYLHALAAWMEMELKTAGVDESRKQSDETKNLPKVESYDLPSIHVQLVTGSLIDQQVDAIVVPVNSHLNLKNGAISKAVLKAGGMSLQIDLNGKKPQGLGPMEVTHTGPGNLKLKHVFYSNLPELSDKGYGFPSVRVNTLMRNIFQLADKLKIQSLALPAFGTGALKYPADVVAMEMIRAIYLYALKSGVCDIRVVVFDKRQEPYGHFEMALYAYEEAVKGTSKACLTSPKFVRVTHKDLGQQISIVARESEKEICDVEILHRKPNSILQGDIIWSDCVFVRKIPLMTMGLTRTRIYMDVSNTLPECPDVGKIYKKALEMAVEDCSAKFVFINLVNCEPDSETTVIIEKFLGKISELSDVLKEHNVQIKFLVTSSSLESCVKYAEQQKTQKTSFTLKKFFVRSPEFKWRVVESRIRSQGGYLVICSRDETRLQSALLGINHHISNNEEDEQARPDYDRLDSKRSSNMSLEKANEDLPRLDSKQSSRSSSASSDNTSNVYDGGSQQDLPMKENNNTVPLRDYPTRDKDQGHIDTLSQASHGEDYIPYEDTTMELPKSRLRHLPRKTLEKLKNSLKKIAKCEFKDGGINIEMLYKDTHKLSEVLDKHLGGIDENVYFVRNVTPAVFHLLELHFDLEPNVLVYHEHDEDLEIRNYEDIYDEAEEKKTWFGSYQMDTIDVSTNNHLVPGALQEIHDKKEEKFQNILLEAVNEYKVINIHYPVEEQNVVTEMKTLLQVRLKLIKQTGRRKRTFDNYTSLQPNFMTSFSTVPDLDTQPQMPSVSKNSTHKQHEDICVDKTPTHDSVRFTTSTRLSTHHSMPAYQRSVSVNIPPRRTDTDISPDIVAETVYLTAKNMKVRVYKGDILNLNVDCIVNAANEQLMHGGGVAAVIARAAGREFQTESKRFIDDNGPLEVGECVCTGAGKLRYKYVLHAVGPQWGMYKDKVDCEDDLRKTIVNILKLTEALKLKSVAIPAISSGIFGVPWDVCAQQYAGGLTSFEDESLGTIEEVHFVDIKEDILNEIRNVFNTEFQFQTIDTDETF